jgi:AraC-like DNA-binding protein
MDDTLPGEVEEALGQVASRLRRDDADEMDAWGRTFVDLARSRAAGPSAAKLAVSRFLMTLRSAGVRLGADSGDLRFDERVRAVWDSDDPKELYEATSNSIRETLLALEKALGHSRTGSRLGGDLVGYLESHFQEVGLSLAELSEVFHVSPAYVSRVFRAHTGTTFQAYLTRLRLSLARSLLVESEELVSDIAVEVGYRETHTFIRAFKRSFSMTPSEYRGVARRSHIAHAEAGGTND